MADIRVGKVSSVNVSARTARVIFGDRGDMVSGELAVLRNSPLITADITTGNKKWSVRLWLSVSSRETYSSAPRTLGRGEHYDKAEPDSISGSLSPDGHKVDVNIYGWLPYIGQVVVCIIQEGGEGCGYIIGGV